jgi:hypothetical protein
MSMQGANTRPALPPGYDSQATYEFRDPSGLFSYAFSNVYGPPKPDRRGPVRHLDEDRSYWSVVGHAEGQDHSVLRSASYADARQAQGGRLTFRQFASEMYMRGKLPKLL